MRIERRAFLGLAAASAAHGAFAWRALAAPVAAARRALVLGAGISGLHAARLLERAGWSVTVLEGRAHAGGRLHTLPSLPGRPEAGGQVVGPSYTRVHALAADVGVTIATARMSHGPRGECSNCHTPSPGRDASRGPGSLLFVSGARVLESEWASRATNLSDEERRIPPSRLLASYLSRHNPLTDAEAWTSADHVGLDAYGIEQFVTMHGATPEAVRLMGVAANCPSIATTSVLWALRDDQRRRAAGGGLPQEFPGGSTSLIDAIARSLARPVLTRHVVSEVATTPDGVAVRCAGGEAFAAEAAVCALPLPAMRRVTFLPALPELQADAVRAIPYTPVSKVFLKVKRPFWTEDGLPISTWTDTGLERLFPLRDDADEVAGLVCFVDGAQAESLDAMGAGARERFVMDEIARIRPAAAGALEMAGYLSWGADPLAGGAYPAFATGQIGRLRAAMCRPRGRLAFAGEHGSIASPGIEGALESAERAVAEIGAAVTA